MTCFNYCFWGKWDEYFGSDWKDATTTKTTTTTATATTTTTAETNSHLWKTWTKWFIFRTTSNRIGLLRLGSTGHWHSLLCFDAQGNFSIWLKMILWFIWNLAISQLAPYCFQMAARTIEIFIRPCHRWCKSSSPRIGLPSERSVKEGGNLTQGKLLFLGLWQGPTDCGSESMAWRT